MPGKRGETLERRKDTQPYLYIIERRDGPTERRIQSATPQRISFNTNSDLIFRTDNNGIILEILKEEHTPPQALNTNVPRHFLNPARHLAYQQLTQETLETGKTNYLTSGCLTISRTVITRNFIITQDTPENLIIYSSMIEG